ncbi:TrbC/VirB2 family protein [Providencia rettgeri]|uniref:TrbC/VirB2 family protein n=1 Tax=Providencia alcalifaciens TaxID=126385 RepID=UPI00029C0CE3|nr:TrbC/VirB2 family protein [Providencia alcalifaciens]EKT61717.1 major pilus subunit of type IV secretion complex (VirB2) [Providencia alcalifaciens Dmel2]
MKLFKKAALSIKSLFPAIVFSAPALAAGGFDKANEALNYWAVGLGSLSVATITFCIIWIGYKVLWNGKSIADMVNVIIGGVLIAGAAGFAAWYAA